MSGLLCLALRNLTERGILVALATGTSGPDTDTIKCPGCTPQAITAAAVDRNTSPTGARCL